MSRCTRRASKRTDRGDGVVVGEEVGERDALGVGVGRGDGVAEAVGPVEATVGGAGGGDSGAAVQLSRSKVDSATPGAATLIRPTLRRLER